jgi:hypothetical protein
MIDFIQAYQGLILGIGCAVLISLSKDDAVALAKDFGLIVYERNTNL